jgi:hypothetical protein
MLPPLHPARFAIKMLNKDSFSHAAMLKTAEGSPQAGTGMIDAGPHHGSRPESSNRQGNDADAFRWNVVNFTP